MNYYQVKQHERQRPHYGDSEESSEHKSSNRWCPGPESSAVWTGNGGIRMDLKQGRELLQGNYIMVGGPVTVNIVCVLIGKVYVW
jgi:hypothetical protein